jgi:hypothetical protein
MLEEKAILGKGMYLVLHNPNVISKTVLPGWSIVGLSDELDSLPVPGASWMLHDPSPRLLILLEADIRPHRKRIFHGHSLVNETTFHGPNRIVLCSDSLLKRSSFRLRTRSCVGITSRFAPNDLPRGRSHRPRTIYRTFLTSTTKSSR